MTTNRVYVHVTNNPGVDGPVTVGAAVAGPYRAMPATANGGSRDLAIRQGAAWEIRSGCVYTHSTQTFTRGVLEDSSSGSAINFTAGAVVAVVSAESSLPTRNETLSLRAAVTGGSSLAVPLLIAKINQQVARNSANAGDNVKQVLFSFVLPAGAMGQNGSLIWEAETSGTNSATSKNFGLRIGSVDICPEYPFSTSTNDHRRGMWHNTSSTAQKYRSTFVQQSSSTLAFTTTAIDTTVDQTVEFYGRWSTSAVSGEVLRLEALRAWVEFGA